MNNAVLYRREAESLLREAMAAEDPGTRTRCLSEAVVWHRRAVAAEERSFVGLGQAESPSSEDPDPDGD